MKLGTETKAQKYLRMYRWMKLQGYSPKLARVSARLHVGLALGGDGYWLRYWKFQ